MCSAICIQEVAVMAMLAGAACGSHVVHKSLLYLIKGQASWGGARIE